MTKETRCGSPENQIASKCTSVQRKPLFVCTWVLSKPLAGDSAPSAFALPKQSIMADIHDILRVSWSKSTGYQVLDEMHRETTSSIAEVDSVLEIVLDPDQAASQTSNAISLLMAAPSSFIYASAQLLVPSQCLLPERMRRAQGDSPSLPKSPLAGTGYIHPRLPRS